MAVACLAQADSGSTESGREQAISRCGKEKKIEFLRLRFFPDLDVLHLSLESYTHMHDSTDSSGSPTCSRVNSG